jgi:hypothetical protein
MILVVRIDSDGTRSDARCGQAIRRMQPISLRSWNGFAGALPSTAEKDAAKGDAGRRGTAIRRHRIPPLPTARGDDYFAIDRAKADEVAKFDGIVVIRTNTEHVPLDAMFCCKQLWRVERIFRATKFLLVGRPIFHKFDETIRGQVLCSLLGLAQKQALEERIASRGLAGLSPQSSPISTR